MSLVVSLTLNRNEVCLQTCYFYYIWNVDEIPRLVSGTQEDRVRGAYQQRIPTSVVELEIETKPTA